MPDHSPNQTGRKERGSQLQAADILESISDAFFSLDRNWRFTYLNRQAERFLRRQGADLLGRNVWEEFPEAVGSIFEREYRQAMADGNSRVFEGFYPPLDAWYEVRAYPAAGALSVFFVDVTERKRVQEALRESREDLNRAQAVAQTGSWRLDVRRNELRWSDEAHRIFGIPPATPLTYETFLAAVHPDDREWVDLAWKAALRGEPYDIEHRIVVDGQIRWVRERAELEFDPAGELLAGFGTSQDVTERKRDALDLQRTVQRFELLARTAGELLQSPEPQRVVESLCRQVMEHLDCQVFFNFLADETAGKLHLNACAGIPPEAARKIEWLEYGVAVCGCVARDGCHIVAEHIPVSADLRTNLVRSYGVRAYACHPLLGPGGRIIGTLSFGTRMRDTFSADDLSLMRAVTDQVAVAMVRMAGEQELRRAKEAAEEASRVKSQFLANMSHEIRTPMSAVMGMLDLVLDSPLEPEQQEQLTIAREGAESLLQVINDILDFSRIEEKKLTFREVSFGLRECVGSAVDLLRPKAVEKGLSLRLEIDPGLPATVTGDPHRLRQVLFNLVGNAVKFTDHGEVTVEVGRSPEQGEGGTLLFSVCDTGIGIPADRLDLLFIPFSQVDGSYTRRFGGTGLGLAICKEIVTRMGGEIGVESREGEGSRFCFTVRLPRAIPESPERNAYLTPSAAPEGCRRILLVEDDRIIRQLMLQLLEKRGWNGTAAASGEEGLALWLADRFDLVLMDIQMPGMDGLEATQAIRRREPEGARVPIIALTAHGTEESRLQCLAAGMDDCLVKPVKLSDLYQTIERHLVGCAG